MSGSPFSVGSILGVGSSTNSNPILELRNLQQRISTSAALSRNDLATRTRLTSERNGLNERSSLFSSLKTEIEKLNTLANGLNTARLIEKSGRTKLAQVTSSNTSVISAKVSGDVGGGTFGINVSQLASAASIGGGSITDIFRSRQLSDVLSVRNANYQQSQAATSASLQSGSVQDIYRSRDLGGVNSVQNANVVQTQTASAASLQGAAIEDIFTSPQLSVAAAVTSSSSATQSQAAATASLQGKSLGTIDAVEVLGDTFTVASAGQDPVTGKSFVQLASPSSLQTGDSVRLGGNGNLKQLKDADGKQVNGDIFVGAKDSSGTKYELYLTEEDAQAGTNALVFAKDTAVSNVSIQHVISPATQKTTGSTTLGVLDSKPSQTYDLSVNGTNFQFDANTTIDTVVSQINQTTSLGLTASFNADTGVFSLVNNQMGAGSITVAGGLETALGLKGKGTTYVDGADEIVAGSYINLKFAANGVGGRISLTTGDKVQLNGTLSGLLDASGNSVTGNTFFVRSKGTSDQEFALFLTKQDAQNGTNALSFAANGSLSGVSVQEVLVDERTDKVTASTTLGQLDNLNSFAFSVNGTDFAFNQNTTVADVVSQINQSGTADVTATFDANSGAISLVSNQAAAGDVVVAGNLAARLGLTGTGVTAVSGQDDVEGGNFIELNSPSGGTLVTGDKVQLNGSIAGLQDAAGNALSGDTFFLRARGGSDQEFSLFLTAEDAQNNTNAVEFSAATNLSNVSVQKVLAESRIDPVTTSTTLGSLDNLSGFSFAVNGAGFDFNADTTIGDVISQLNQSADASVTASFNSETRTISLVNNQAGAGDVAVSGDLASRLSLTGATATAVSGQDAALSGNFIELNSASGGILATGDKIQLNGSLSGLKDANGNAVSGESLFVGSRSGSDQEFALFLTAEDALNNTNALTFSEEANLSGVSVQKVFSEASTEQVNTSTQLGQLDNLTSFSFSVNGADFEFDADTTISTVLSRINGSSSAGVQATFNAETRQISFTNKSTGEGDVTVSGNLADRLGLTSPAASVVSGKNAIATISGGLQDGQVISSRDNTLSASETGVGGLTFTVNGVGSTTITSTEGGNRNLPEASVVTQEITEFFDQFNKVQAFLEANSEKGGRVFGDIANGLRGSLREVFGNSDISGSIGSTGTSNQFSVDKVGLAKGVEGGLSGVLDLFRGPNGAGFAARTSNFLKSYTGSTGTLSQEITRIGRTESSVTDSLASLNQKEENNRKRLNESLAGISKAVISIQIRQGFLSGLGGADTSSGREVNPTREGSTGLSLLGQQDQAQAQATAAGITTGSSSGSGFNLENNMSGIENFINGLFK